VGDFSGIELPLATDASAGNDAALDHLLDFAAIAVQPPHEFVHVPGLMFYHGNFR